MPYLLHGFWDLYIPWYKFDLKVRAKSFGKKKTLDFPKSVNQIWSRMKIFYKEEVTPIKIPIHNSRLKSTLDRMASGEVAIKAMPLTF